MTRIEIAAQIIAEARKAAAEGMSDEFWSADVCVPMMMDAEDAEDEDATILWWSAAMSAPEAIVAMSEDEFVAAAPWAEKYPKYPK